VLEGSLDLINWAPLSTNVMTDASMSFSVPRHTGQPYCFYRMVRCPCISPACYNCSARLSAPAMMQEGYFQIQLSSAPGKTHVIESSPDLEHWSAVQTNTMTAETMMIHCPMGKGASQQFFRAIRCP
jgi:hypothetical protein